MNLSARHPNTPPELLVSLIAEYADAFCQNPVAPFLPLEIPDFAARVRNVRAHLLREQYVPLSLLAAIAEHAKTESAEQNSSTDLLHVALYGEVQGEVEGETKVTSCWYEHIASYVARLEKPQEDTRQGRFRRWRDNSIVQPNGDMVELGLAPQWVNKPPLFVDPRPPEPSSEAKQRFERTAALNSLGERELWKRIAPELATRPELVACIRGAATEKDLATLADIPEGRDGYLHEIIAAHPNAGTMVFERLLHSKTRHEVLRLIVAHQNASEEFITMMVQFPDAEVRRLARRHENAPPNSVDLSKQAVLRQWRTRPSRCMPFERFVAGLHGALMLDALYKCAMRQQAEDRLVAAFALPTEAISIPSSTDEEDEKDDSAIVNYYNQKLQEAAGAGCTTRDLLEHLARDGNRLVRWAAQTRLQNPDYVFRWAEPGEPL